MQIFFNTNNEKQEQSSGYIATIRSNFACTYEEKLLKESIPDNCKKKKKATTTTKTIVERVNQILFVALEFTRWKYFV